ncbi:MAG: hypothetical protein RR891_10255 [Clostridium sp.]|uniref:hypothetical protein n=1 Tax=Clostridium sp. TaxID=1506 RepID=UPI003056E5E1
MAKKQQSVEEIKATLENTLNNIYVKFTLIKEIHEGAYKLNPEYKIFWDSHPEKTRKALLVNQKPMSIPEEKVDEKKISISRTFKKMFNVNKLPMEYQIENCVTGRNFTKTLKEINQVMWNK